jgi:hypothetical protein
VTPRRILLSCSRPSKTLPAADVVEGANKRIEKKEMDRNGNRT